MILGERLCVYWTGYICDIYVYLNSFLLQKKGRDFDKLEKVLRPDELTATLSCLSKEQRLAYLENTFQENLDMYRHVLERLSIAVWTKQLCVENSK